MDSRGVRVMHMEDSIRRFGYACPGMRSPAAKLLAWYRASGRDLPWRKTRDPYRILVSEVMLQQTQVHRVLGYYDRWLTQFPTWAELAKANNADVITMWAGLGYNRRGLMLRDIARQIVGWPHPTTNYQLPTTRESWMKLKGIGPYTSAAISAFAQRKRVMPVDTNVRRVLGRLLLGKPFAQFTDDGRLEKRADTLLPMRGNYWDVPQAIFDLATSICTKEPDCARCPLRKDCPAAKKFLAGSVRIPKQSVKKAVESKHRDKPHPDRIYRGRILKLVREEPNIAADAVGARVDPDFDERTDRGWMDAMVQRLVKDGLLSQKKGRLSLPE